MLDGSMQIILLSDRNQVYAILLRHSHSMQHLTYLVFTMTSARETTEICFNELQKMHVILVLIKRNSYQFKSLWQLVQSIRVNNLHYSSQQQSSVAFIFISKFCFYQVIPH